MATKKNVGREIILPRKRSFFHCTREEGGKGGFTRKEKEHMKKICMKERTEEGESVRRRVGAEKGGGTLHFSWALYCSRGRCLPALAPAKRKETELGAEGRGKEAGGQGLQGRQRGF